MIIVATIFLFLVSAFLMGCFIIYVIHNINLLNTMTNRLDVKIKEITLPSNKPSSKRADSLKEFWSQEVIWNTVVDDKTCMFCKNLNGMRMLKRQAEDIMREHHCENPDGCRCTVSVTQDSDPNAIYLGWNKSKYDNITNRMFSEEMRR